MRPRSRWRVCEVALRLQISTTQVGLSEHDLNRARSVLGLPVSGAGARGEQDTDLGYDSQPASTRNSINVSTAHA